MPGYVHGALVEFQHPQLTKPEHQLYRHNPPQYGVKVQMMEPHEDSPSLDKPGIL
jgi:hypothetical protein